MNLVSGRKGQGVWWINITEVSCRICIWIILKKMNVSFISAGKLHEHGGSLGLHRVIKQQQVCSDIEILSLLAKEDDQPAVNPLAAVQ